MSRCVAALALASTMLAACTSAGGPGLATANADLGVTGTASLASAGLADPGADPSVQGLEGAADGSPPDSAPQLPSPKPQSPGAPAEAFAEPASINSAEAAADVEAEPPGKPEEKVADAAASAASVELVDRKKQTFLSSFFGGKKKVDDGPAPLTDLAAPAPAPSLPNGDAPALPEPRPVVETAPTPKPLMRLASAESGDDGTGNPSAAFAENALPGVRQTMLFEIKRRSGVGDESDIDLHEEEGDAPVVLASAAGLARLDPRGLLKQRESVDTACLKPKLLAVLKSAEQRFGRRLIVTSGYRSPSYNKKVRGAKKSQHMYCAAADIQMPGISKWELARYFRSLPGRGGVGTYCHTDSIHVDIGPERDWNWRCGRRG